MSRRRNQTMANMALSCMRWLTSLAAMGVVRRSLPSLSLSLLLTAALVGAGCTTVVRTTESRDIQRSSAPDQGDPQRRAQVRLELAGLYFGRGQLSTALEEVRQALQAKPDMAEAHGLRGLILASMGDSAAAEISLQRAIALSPGEGGTLHNYAWFLCQERRFDDADKQFAAALQVPQYRDASRSLLAQGVCQARAGRMAAAERSLLRSFELDPANPVTAYNLSEVLLKLGDLIRAKFYVLRVNVVPEQVSAQSLWLLIRVEHRLRDQDAVLRVGQQLRSRFPQSPEALKLDRGQFDD